MYTHPTYDRLHALHLSGMLHALEHQEQHPEIAAMPSWNVSGSSSTRNGACAIKNACNRVCARPG